MLEKVKYVLDGYKNLNDRERMLKNIQSVSAVLKKQL